MTNMSAFIHEFCRRSNPLLPCFSPRTRLRWIPQDPITLAPLLLVLALCFCLPLGAQQTLEVSNVAPRLTVAGDTVDAHDGRIIRFGDRFYWYGTSYGTTNGFTTANHYVVYSSPDLKDWTYENRLLPNQPEGVYYRPHVIYNEENGEYVLWYNWYPKLWEGQFGVAVSDTPTGPFRIVNDDVKMARSAEGLGDFGLFVDDDGTGYISYNTINEHQVSIEKLSPDYRSSTRENGGVIAKHMEAGSQFKRDGKYYLMTDWTCCFCNYGSGARVYVSDDPLTGYVLTSNVNRRPGQKLRTLNDGTLRGADYATFSRREKGWEHLVLDFDEPKMQRFLAVHLFTGNRPENCGQVDNPRVHPEIVIPNLRVEALVDGNWRPVSGLRQKHRGTATATSLNLTFDPQVTRMLRLRFDADTSLRQVYVNEVSAGYPYEAFRTGPGIRQTPIIPAQQTYVMRLETTSGPEFIWMGDMWGSATDNVKGHDYQYWGAPLRFNRDGSVRRLRWTDEWSVELRE